MSLLNKARIVGLKKATNALERKKIILLNTLIILGVLINLISFFYSFFIGSSFLMTVYAVITIIYVLVLYVHAKKGYSIARTFFWTINYLFFSCFIFFISPDNLGIYFSVMAILSLLFFDNRLVNTFGFLLSVFGFYYTSSYQPLSSIIVENHPLDNAVVLFGLIYFIVWAFKHTNRGYETRLKKQHEEALKMQSMLDKQSKELAALNKFQNHFFVNVTHELRTPLTLIKGKIHSMILDNENPVYTEKIKNVSNQVSKIESLVNDIIDIAKIESHTLVLNKKSVGANQLTQKIYLSFEPLFIEKNIHFSISLQPKEHYIEADILYLEKVLGNILVNALKYTPKGGSVSIKVEEKENTIVFSVTDTGIGVKEEDLENIFKRFYQSENEINKAGGSGIGLAFCKEIIELHNGNIFAKKGIHNGLIIEFSLSKISSNVLPMNKNLSSEKKVFIFSSDKKILIVDDNQEMRAYLKSILNNYNTIEAENGKEALDVVKNNTVDAIVTDYMMPVMDGQALVENLKEKNINIPIIVLTARADVKSKLSMLQLGVDDYLTKPFIEEELLFRLRNVLQNDGERQEFIKNIAEENDSFQGKNHKIISKAKRIVQENISNSYFGVAQLSDILEISERTLYRILKKETGLSPNLFIRDIKLLHIRTLLEQKNNFSLQELASSIGLTNGSYLNQLYKERFGRVINE